MNFDLNVCCGVEGDDDSISGNVGSDDIHINNVGSEHVQLNDENLEFTSVDQQRYDEDDFQKDEDGDVGEAFDDGEDVGEEDGPISMNHNNANVPDDDIQEGEYSIEVSKKLVEDLLNVGSVVDTLDEVHVLYREYARLCGFSVRKGTQGYFLDSLIVRYKLYHCSCEGLSDNKRSIGRVPVCKKQSYRSNCKAKLRVCREDVDSPWKVTVFMKQHNHKLLHPSESYLLRSARNMSQSKKSLLVALTSSGIGVSRAYHFMETESGSRTNVGFLRKDVYNELNRDRSKMAKVANGDTNRLIEHLTEKGLSDPSFYWKVKVGDDGRLQNLLFRDGRCLIDYQHFGDVVSVDATYKTNKYDLICVPIIGIKKHCTNVLFAMAFLTNEKTDSYEWLFKTFLESMYHKEPTIIFSDQDQALMNSLDNTFRTASHRLCQWHINKNAGKQFGKLNCNKEFKGLWYRCMNGCENEEEFEHTWVRMIDAFNLKDNRWFKSMYTLRNRWSSAFTRDKFFGGLHATSRSEVTNKVLKELCSSTSSMFDFIVGFDKMQKNWRTREFEEDVFCRGMPGTFVQRSGIMLQLGQLCTRNIFKLFEAEVLNSITVKMSEEPPDLNDQISQFKIASSSAMKGYRVVKIHEETKMGTCSCGMWEIEGIICRHLFKVYFHLNLDRVPDGMVLQRWRHDSKDRIPISERAIAHGGPNKFSNMVFVNHNAKRFYDLLCECKDDTVCQDAINEYLKK